MTKVFQSLQFSMNKIYIYVKETCLRQKLNENDCAAKRCLYTQFYINGKMSLAPGCERSNNACV